jgi:hypothetical protein
MWSPPPQLPPSAWRPRPWGAFLVVLCLSACSQPAADQIPVIEETFAKKTYDRNSWIIDPTKLPEAKFLFEDDGLRLQIPVKSNSKEPAEVKSRFKLTGDFDMSLEYTIRSLPTTPEESCRLEIGLYGTAGSAAFRRSQLKGVPGYSLWFQPAGEDAKTFYRFQPLDVAVEGRSRLRVVRTGEEIRFTVQSYPDQEPWEVATITYPGVVNSAQFRIFGKPQKEPVDVLFHGIRVSGEDLWFGQTAHQPTTTGWSTPVTVGIALLLGAAAGGVVIWRLRAEE